MAGRRRSGSKRGARRTDDSLARGRVRRDEHRLVPLEALDCAALKRVEREGVRLRGLVLGRQGGRLGRCGQGRVDLPKARAINEDLASSLAVISTADSHACSPCSFRTRRCSKRRGEWLLLRVVRWRFDVIVLDIGGGLGSSAGVGVATKPARFPGTLMTGCRPGSFARRSRCGG